MTIWLASGSPRRKQLLEDAGFDVLVRPSSLDETRRAGEAAVAYVQRLAREKAAFAPPEALVVAADTSVWLDPQTVLGKPSDASDAIAMLTALSSRSHCVSTGVCLRRGDRATVFAVTTRVRFRSLSRAEIERYVATGECADKAGAYAIQGGAGAFVSEIVGSWTNVVGLPMERVVPLLHVWA